MDLPISNIVNVSVSQNPAGIGSYNTSNVALFTSEPKQASFGSDPFKIYYDPTDVAKDFGSDSKTYAAAVALFSQSPNIRTGGGYLVIIPLLPGVAQLFSFSGDAASGQIVLTYGGHSATIHGGDNAATIQSAIRAIPGAEQAIVEGDLTALNGLTIHKAPHLTLASGQLLTSNLAQITTTPSNIADGNEKMVDALVRMNGSVAFFGVASTDILDSDEMLDAAAFVQSQNMMYFVVSQTPADVETGGQIDQLRTQSLDQTRGLFYGASAIKKVMGMLGAYIGRALSTDFSGTNTTQTMQLKDLKTVDADQTLDTNLFAKCKAAGADVVGSIQGITKTLTSGANRFFDQVYNQLWFTGALQVSTFNFLATISTKIPQTEAGMDGLRKAVRDVCEQGITNGYIAPGEWTSAIPFGDPVDFVENIRLHGYYIYSIPVAQQAAADRAGRKAPVVQVAIKEAGAIHESDLIVNINP